MATISNTPRPGYVWDSADNVWYPIGVGAHQHTNAADTPAVMPYSTYAAAGKNKFLNSDFNINQRAFTSTTSSGVYTFDRWITETTNGTNTYSAQTFTAGAAPVSGYEATNYARVITTGVTGGYVLLGQKIEDVRSFANQTFTVSFWAKAGSGTPKITAGCTQVFGTGGSGSLTNGAAVPQTISTSWQRYSFTIGAASVSGKTIGTGSSLFVYILVSDAVISTVGVQNNTFDIWGVQVEAGSTATAFQTATGTIQGELAACQRYFYKPNANSQNIFYAGFNNSTTEGYFSIPLQTEMRINPTVTVTSASTNLAVRVAGGTNVAATTTSVIGNTVNVIWLSVSVTAGLVLGQGSALVNIGTSKAIEMSAEL